MKPLSVRDIRMAVSGKLVTEIVGREPVARTICTDTRKIEPGCLFVALRGEKHDGHAYLEQAAAAGAVAAVVETLPATPIANFPLIQVANTRHALGRLGTTVRKQLRAKVIGVGGSNGKTSTKHLIDAALRKRLRGSISPKSFNNDIGVPLTIFDAKLSDEYLVLEMGTNHPGELKVLSDMAQPDLAVITNVGPEHLEGFGDLDGVRREEASIVAGLNDRGLLIVNGDDHGLLEAVSAYRGKRITFGLQVTNDLFPSDIRCDASGVRFRLNTSRTEVFVPLLGRHTAVNALAAIAVARRLGVPDQTIIEGLAEATGPDMRLQLLRAGTVTILNDAYNANPASMAAALRTLGDLETSGRRVAVLGDMFELGATTEEAHRELGRQAAALSLDLLCCVGTHTRLAADAAITAGMPADRVLHLPDAATAASTIPDRLSDGDLVLLKGSRGMKLETVAAGITGRFGEAPLRAAS